jgi:hypothetical protein
MVFNSGGDRSPIQRPYIRLDPFRAPWTFSWRFPDGREETFHWRESELPEVREINGARLGTGKKCIRNKTGKIVAAIMPPGLRQKRMQNSRGRMAFFRWNMSKDMGNEFECMLVMNIVVGEQLYRKSSRDNRPVESHQVVHSRVHHHGHPGVTISRF